MTVEFPSLYNTNNVIIFKILSLLSCNTVNVLILFIFYLDGDLATFLKTWKKKG